MEKKEFLVKEDKHLENRVVSIGNEIIKVRYKLTLPTQKLLLFLISHITYEERKEGKFLHTLRFPIAIIYNFFKKTGRENDKNLKKLVEESIEELKIKTVDVRKIYNSDLEKYTSYTWYTKTDIDQKTKDFLFSFNDELACALLKIKGYFKSSIKEYLYLRSTYAINLYMFFRTHEHLKNIHKRVSVEELKSYLQVNENKTYKKWPEFKRRILDSSINQLNENTNYIFTYTLERVGKNVGIINFSVIDKNDSNAISNELHKRIESYLLKKKIYKASHKLFEEVKFVFDDAKSFLFILLPFKHFGDVSNLELREFRGQERNYQKLHEDLKIIFIEHDFKKNVFSEFFRKKINGDFFKYDSTQKAFPPLEFLYQKYGKSKKNYTSS